MNPNESKNTRILWSWGAGSSEAACFFASVAMVAAQRTVTKASQSVNARNTHQRDEYFEKEQNKRTTNSTRTQERAAVQTAAGALHS